ncbi:MAG: BTAD domain-containing putative transcriptional regulator [Vicinamibacterales bacterium]
MTADAHPVFRVLGPLRISDGDVPGGQFSRLLGALLFEPGRDLAAEQLAGWALGPERSDDLPQLQVLAARVRRLWRDRQLPGRLTSARGTYRLDVDPLLIDAGRFQALCTAADQRHADQPALAAAELEAALALWRGDVLGGTGLADHPVALALEEQRDTAVEHHFLVRFAAGQPPSTPELLEACRRRPDRERRVSIAMIALALEGRRHEALALYHRTRVERLERIGLEPSPALQAVELAVLRHELDAVIREVLHLDPSAITRAERDASAVMQPIDARLPRFETSFVGRHALLQDLETATEHSGLVTLVGPGGAGKTRLVCELLSRSPRPVQFVELASLPADADASSVARHVARRCDVRIEPHQAPLDALSVGLGDRAAVIVLDSCELVLDGIRTVIEPVLERCPTLTVVATSRAALRLPAERTVTVEPLPIDSEAVELYRHRCIDAGARPDPDAHDAERALCAKLDGLPLAIELAAARARSLGPAELAGASLIGLHAPEAVPARERRHTSLSATIAWSYRLLDPAQQAMLRRMSTIAGELRLDDLVTLLAPDEKADAATAEQVGALVDVSLAVARSEGGVRRYRLLDTVRAFAAAEAEASGELASLRRHHAERIADVLDELRPALRGPDEPVAVARLDELWAEVRTAVDTALTARDAQLAVRLLAGLGFEAVFRERGELVGWLDRALHLDGIEGVDGADELLGTAALADWGYGRFDPGLERAQRAVALHRQRSTTITPDVAAALPLHLSMRGDLGATVDCLRNHVRSADDQTVPYAATHLTICEAMGLGFAGRSEEADRLLVDAERRAASLGCRLLQAIAAFTAAIVVLDRRPAEAVGHTERCLTIADQVGATWFRSAANNYLVAALVRSGSVERAIGLLDEGLARLRRGGTTQSIANSIRNAVAALDASGRADLAVPLIGWLQVTPAAIPGTPGMRNHAADLAARLRTDLGEAAFEIARAAGATFSTHDVIDAARAALATVDRRSTEAGHGPP